MRAYLPALFLAAVLRGPEAVSESGSSGERVVSPAVVASWTVHSRGEGPPALGLLILWRGTPGWFLKEESQQSSGTMSTGPTGQSVTQRLRYGGIDFEVVFDPVTRVGRIGATELALGDSNVVLVDDVDGADGARVVRAMRVETPLSNADAVVEQTIRASKELQDYLRCDARVPDEAVQQMLDALCARMTGP